MDGCHPHLFKNSVRDYPLRNQPGGPRQSHPPPVVLLQLLEIADVLVRPDEIASSRHAGNNSASSDSRLIL
jgi:hypothetical protein